jgi:serine/threonine-protein kinase CLA4
MQRYSDDNHVMVLHANSSHSDVDALLKPREAPQPPKNQPRPSFNSASSFSVPPSPSSALSPASYSYTPQSIQETIPINRSMSNLGGQGGVAVIKDGWAQVKESKNFIQPWKQKFLVLRKDTLDFHKSEGGKVTYTLYLKDVLAVARVEAPGFIFEIKRQSNGSSTSPGDDDGSVRTLQMRVKGDEDLYEWVDFIQARCPGMGGVSNPTNFSHAVHVGFDPGTGEFVGLPPEWSKLLASSAITAEDARANPQAVFEVLDFYSDLTKRAENPAQYSSLTPTPPATNNQNKQLGYVGGGASVAPPRPAPQQMSSAASFGQRPAQADNYGPRRPSPPDSQQQQRQQMQNMAPNYRNPQDDARAREAEASQRQRMREAEEQNRRDMEAYNASMAQTEKPRIAQQELGGYGGGSTPTTDRFNPNRPPPQKPLTQPRQGAPLAQRPAPPRPVPGPGTVPAASAPRSVPTRNDQPNGTAPSQNRYPPNGSSNVQQPRTNGQAPASQTSRLPIAKPQPLNVNKPQQSDSVKAAEAALTAKPSPAERKQDVRMSTMSESEVMAKLKEAVSKDDPNQSYSKQKKIGQGASGSVYVAKVKETAPSAVARDLLRRQGNKAQVAIKQMDLAHQPRKELIVNEIMVMKDSKHPNIVNFLDAFLRNNNSELWVVMEYMEGGALTDVIDNNPVITEEQISTICLEVR